LKTQIKWELSRFFIFHFLEQTSVKIGQNRHNFSKKGSQRGSQNFSEKRRPKIGGGW
jgi:hypothetical protein